ncbi:MAG: hypothetical protein R3F25_09225 [Gammaproteobacteria bacterium]
MATDIGGWAENLNVLFNSDAGAAVLSGDHAITPDFVNDSTPETANALDSFDGESSNGNLGIVRL